MLGAAKVSNHAAPLRRATYEKAAVSSLRSQRVAWCRASGRAASPAPQLSVPAMQS